MIETEVTSLVLNGNEINKVVLVLGQKQDVKKMKIISETAVAISVVEDGTCAIIHLSSELEKYLVKNPVCGPSDYTDLPGVEGNVQSSWRQFSPSGRRPGQSRMLSEEARRKREEARMRTRMKLVGLQRKRDELMLNKAMKRKLKMQMKESEIEKMAENVYEGSDDLESPNIIISSPSKKPFHRHSSPLSRSPKAMTKLNFSSDRMVFRFSRVSSKAKADSVIPDIKSDTDEKNSSDKNDGDTWNVVKSPDSVDVDAKQSEEDSVETEDMDSQDSLYTPEPPKRTLRRTTQKSNSKSKYDSDENWSEDTDEDRTRVESHKVRRNPKKLRKRNKERVNYSEIDDNNVDITEDYFQFTPSSSTKSGRRVIPVSRKLEEAIVSASMAKSKKRRKREPAATGAESKTTADEYVKKGSADPITSVPNSVPVPSFHEIQSEITNKLLSLPNDVITSGSGSCLALDSLEKGETFLKKTAKDNLSVSGNIAKNLQGVSVPAVSKKSDSKNQEASLPPGSILHQHFTTQSNQPQLPPQPWQTHQLQQLPQHSQMLYPLPQPQPFPPSNHPPHPYPLTPDFNHNTQRVYNPSAPSASIPPMSPSSSSSSSLPVSNHHFLHLHHPTPTLPSLSHKLPTSNQQVNNFVATHTSQNIPSAASVTNPAISSLSSPSSILSLPKSHISPNFLSTPPFPATRYIPPLMPLFPHPTALLPSPSYHPIPISNSPHSHMMSTSSVSTPMTTAISVHTPIITSLHPSKVSGNHRADIRPTKASHALSGAEQHPAYPGLHRSSIEMSTRTTTGTTGYFKNPTVTVNCTQKPVTSLKAATAPNQQVFHQNHAESESLVKAKRSVPCVTTAAAAASQHNVTSLQQSALNLSKTSTFNQADKRIGERISTGTMSTKTAKKIPPTATEAGNGSSDRTIFPNSAHDNKSSKSVTTSKQSSIMDTENMLNDINSVRQGKTVGSASSKVPTPHTSTGNSNSKAQSVMNVDTMLKNIQSAFEKKMKESSNTGSQSHSDSDSGSTRSRHTSSRQDGNKDLRNIASPNSIANKPMGKRPEPSSSSSQFQPNFGDKTQLENGVTPPLNLSSYHPQHFSQQQANPHRSQHPSESTHLNPRLPPQSQSPIRLAAPRVLPSGNVNRASPQCIRQQQNPFGPQMPGRPHQRPRNLFDFAREENNRLQQIHQFQHINHGGSSQPLSAPLENRLPNPLLLTLNAFSQFNLRPTTSHLTPGTHSHTQQHQSSNLCASLPLAQPPSSTNLVNSNHNNPKNISSDNSSALSQTSQQNISPNIQHTKSSSSQPFESPSLPMGSLVLKKPQHQQQMENAKSTIGNKTNSSSLQKSSSSSENENQTPGSSVDSKMSVIIQRHLQNHRAGVNTKQLHRDGAESESQSQDPKTVMHSTICERESSPVDSKESLVLKRLVQQQSQSQISNVKERLSSNETAPDLPLKSRPSALPLSPMPSPFSSSSQQISDNSPSPIDSKSSLINQGRSLQHQSQKIPNNSKVAESESSSLGHQRASGATVHPSSLGDSKMSLIIQRHLQQHSTPTKQSTDSEIFQQIQKESGSSHDQPHLAAIPVVSSSTSLSRQSNDPIDTKANILRNIKRDLSEEMEDEEDHYNEEDDMEEDHDDEMAGFEKQCDVKPSLKDLQRKISPQEKNVEPLTTPVTRKPLSSAVENIAIVRTCGALLNTSPSISSSVLLSCSIAQTYLSSSSSMVSAPAQSLPRPSVTTVVSATVVSVSPSIMSTSPISSAASSETNNNNHKNKEIKITIGTSPSLMNLIAVKKELSSCESDEIEEEEEENEEPFGNIGACSTLQIKSPPYVGNATSSSAPCPSSTPCTRNTMLPPSQALSVIVPKVTDVGKLSSLIDSISPGKESPVLGLIQSITQLRDRTKEKSHSSTSSSSLSSSLQPPLQQEAGQQPDQTQSDNPVTTSENSGKLRQKMIEATIQGGALSTALDDSLIQSDISHPGNNNQTQKPTDLPSHSVTNEHGNTVSMCPDENNPDNPTKRIPRPKSCASSVPSNKNSESDSSAESTRLFKETNKSVVHLTQLQDNSDTSASTGISVVEPMEVQSSVSNPGQLGEGEKDRPHRSQSNNVVIPNDTDKPLEHESNASLKNMVQVVPEILENVLCEEPVEETRINQKDSELKSILTGDDLSHCSSEQSTRSECGMNVDNADAPTGKDERLSSILVNKESVVSGDRYENCNDVVSKDSLPPGDCVGQSVVGHGVHHERVPECASLDIPSSKISKESSSSGGKHIDDDGRKQSENRDLENVVEMPSKSRNVEMRTESRSAKKVVEVQTEIRNVDKAVEKQTENRNMVIEMQTENRNAEKVAETQAENRKAEKQFENNNVPMVVDMQTETGNEVTSLDSLILQPSSVERTGNKRNQSENRNNIENSVKIQTKTTDIEKASEIQMDKDVVIEVVEGVDRVVTADEITARNVEIEVIDVDSNSGSNCSKVVNEAVVMSVDGSAVKGINYTVKAKSDELVRVGDTVSSHSIEVVEVKTDVVPSVIGKSNDDSYVIVIEDDAICKTPHNTSDIVKDVSHSSSDEKAGTKNVGESTVNFGDSKSKINLMISDNDDIVEIIDDDDDTTANTNTSNALSVIKTKDSSLGTASASKSFKSTVSNTNVDLFNAKTNNSSLLSIEGKSVQGLTAVLHINTTSNDIIELLDDDDNDIVKTISATSTTTKTTETTATMTDEKNESPLSGEKISETAEKVKTVTTDNRVVEILSSDEEDNSELSKEGVGSSIATSNPAPPSSRLSRIFSVSDDGVSSRSSHSPLSSPSGSGGVVSRCIQSIGLWSKDQVAQWLASNKLDKICLNLTNLDGPGLQRMAFEFHRNPEVFYVRVKKSLGLTLFQTLVIERSLKSLIHSMANSDA